MSKPERLIDIVIAESYRGKAIHPRYGEKLIRARKFVFDDSMSAHIADLTCAPFINPDQEFVYRIADGARRMARLPFPITWIEYNALARKERTETEYPNLTSSGKVEASKCIPLIGWLLEQHPAIPTAYRLTEFVDLDDGKAVSMPVSYTWVSDDQTVLPWRNIDGDTFHRALSPSEIGSGVMGYRNQFCGTTFAEFNLIKFDTPEKRESVRAMMLETLGELRAVWTVLATLNDLPVVLDSVRPDRGHMMRGGNYRRFVDHSVVRLVVPAHRSLRTLATRALIKMQRRAHGVRGHWRNDWRHPRTPGCDHDWINFNEHTLACRHCEGRRIWVDAHQRCDASKGLLLQEYSVGRATA